MDIVEGKYRLFLRGVPLYSGKGMSKEIVKRRNKYIIKIRSLLRVHIGSCEGIFLLLLTETFVGSSLNSNLALFLRSSKIRNMLNCLIKHFC